MKKTIKREFPPGWNEKKVRAVIAHYDMQTDEEGAAEIESAPEATGETWIAVPNELLEPISRLIREHEQKGPATGNGKHAKKARTGKVRKFP
jgi:hypothetical protein